MTVLVIFLICAPLLIFFLAAPIILSIDTDTDDYSIRLGDMCSLRALTAFENPGVRLRIGFWKKTWGLKDRLLRLGTKRSGASGNRPDQNSTDQNRSSGNGSKTNGGTKTKEVVKRDMSRNSTLRMWRILKTFRVSKCDVLIDTDDFILNAQLFPLFQFCSGRWGYWRINFEGDCRVQIEVESRLISVLYAWWWKK